MANYRDSLTPSQAEEMGRFLIALSNAGEKCKQAGVRPDVGAAMKEWSGTKMTNEEHRERDRLRYREKHGLMG